MKRFLLLVCLVALILARPLATLANPHAQSTFTPYKEVWRIGEGVILNAAWSPDGTQLAVLTSRGIHFYDETMTEVDFWEQNYVTSLFAETLIWSPNSQFLLMQADPDNLIVWNVPAHTPVNKLSRDDNPMSMVWSPDSRQILYRGYVTSASGREPQVKLWNVVTNEISVLIPESYLPVAWHSPNQVYLSNSYDHTSPSNYHLGILVVWDIAMEAVVDTMDLPILRYNSRIIVSPDLTMVAVGGYESTVIIDLKTHHTTMSLPLIYQDDIVDIVWKHDSNMVATLSSNGTVQVEQILPRHRVISTSLKSHNEEYIVGFLKWHPSQSLLLLGHSRQAFLWNLTENPTELIQGSLPPQYRYYHSSFEFFPVYFDWLPDGSQIATAQFAGISIQDVATKATMQTFDYPQPENLSQIMDIDWNPKQNLVLFSVIRHEGDSLGYLLDGNTGTILATYPSIYRLTWNPQGTEFIGRGVTTTGYISYRQDIRDRAHTEPIMSITPWINFQTVVWSPDGQWIANSHLGHATPDYGIFLWNRVDGSLRDTFVGNVMSWSPAGNYLATGNDRILQIRDIATGLSVLDILTDVQAMAWHPQQNLLATTDNSAIYFWDTETGELLQEIVNPYDNILSMKWSADGHYLAAGSSDYVVTIWGQE